MGAPEAPMLNGFVFGNKKQDGCLTKEQETQLHSCEPGTDCHARLSETGETVWIIPIVTRTPGGIVVPEVGAGGGGGDLYQVPELDTADAAAIVKLEELCSRLIDNTDTLREALQKLSAANESGRMRLSLEGLGQNSHGNYSVEDMISLLANKNPQQELVSPVPSELEVQSGSEEKDLPNVIRFPYSRHSSHSELRHLVSILRPKDIYPCTFDAQNWTEDCSIEELFGDLCSERVFSHDRSMRVLVADRQNRETTERKRKRDDEDDKLATSDIESTQSASYETVERHPSGNLQLQEHSQPQSLEVDPEADTIKTISVKGDSSELNELPTSYSQMQPVSPPKAQASINIPSEEPEQTHILESYTDRPSSSSSFTPSPPLSPNTRLRNIKDAYDRLQNPPPDPQASSDPPPDIPQLDGPIANASTPHTPQNPPDSSDPPSSPLTISTSFFESQHSQALAPNDVSPGTERPDHHHHHHHHSASARKAAYRAARAAALHDDDEEASEFESDAPVNGGGAGGSGGFGLWEVFATRSGGNSHTDKEMEL
ncbi:MAG: hypothetical protein Q9160_005012 [Pyrenula sp. 1 TL-2023]